VGQESRAQVNTTRTRATPEIQLSDVTLQLLAPFRADRQGGSHPRGALPPEQRQQARQSIAYHAKRFAKTGNPLHAWAAVEECIAANLPLPSWARTYLLGVAGSLSQNWKCGSKVPTRDTIDRAVASAVGVKGRGGFNPFREMHAQGHEHLIAVEVYWHYNRTKPRNITWEAVWREVAESHHQKCDRCTKELSWQKVRQFWYAYAMDVIPRHLIDRSKSKKLDDILR